ncbi:Hypothetical predicted protein [Paramuricea clavata]|uniref:Uncharacterized protein n=1 Tax=Paramuricea clavata TaxID=317549 RepID=A0A6S7IKP7_PARCT|nr:Hypothetical predicted protein [Paramuricea clavata]
MDTIEMNDFDQPEGAEGGDEGVTPVDEDDFRGGLNDNDRLDDAKTSSFYEENKDDSYRKRTVGEHITKARSVVEEETGGEASGETAEDILEDAREELHQETITASETLAEQAGRLEREELETDPDKRQIMQKGRDVAEQGIDDARLEMGQQPESEEGRHRFREKVREDIRTRFERFRRWAKENLDALTAIAISVAGIITTIVLAGKKTIVRASKGLGAVGKALAGLAKSALPILVPILNLLSAILSWGAKDLAFLAKNLWIVVILIAGAIYKYFQSRQKK